MKDNDDQVNGVDQGPASCFQDLFNPKMIFFFSLHNAKKTVIHTSIHSARLDKLKTIKLVKDG